MRKILVIVISLVLLTAGTALADFTDHPNYANINTLTKSFIQTIADSQGAYFILNGRYFQGIRIPSMDTDGVTYVTLDNTAKPYDQNESWKDFNSSVFQNNLKIPYNIYIHTYGGPLGQGWILFIELWYPGIGPDAYENDGDHWIYTHHEGPEQLRSGIYD